MRWPVPLVLVADFIAELSLLFFIRFPSLSFHTREWGIFLFFSFSWHNSLFFPYSGNQLQSTAYCRASVSFYLVIFRPTSTGYLEYITTPSLESTTSPSYSSIMVLSHVQCEAALQHILENVFDLDPDSPLHKAFKYNGITSPADLLAIPVVKYEILHYPVNNKLKIIPRGHASLLRALQAYVLHIH